MQLVAVRAWQYGRGSELLHPNTFTAADRQEVEGLTLQQLVASCRALAKQQGPCKAAEAAGL